MKLGGFFYCICEHVFVAIAMTETFAAFTGRGHKLGPDDDGEDTTVVKAATEDGGVPLTQAAATSQAEDVGDASMVGSSQETAEPANGKDDQADQVRALLLEKLESLVQMRV